LREKLDVSYRQVRSITTLHNSPSSKLERQVAASHYIQYMISGKRIMNLDESVVRCTEHRKKGWRPNGCQHMETQNYRLSNINLIAVVSNRGEFFYTVNQGVTNSYTLGHFLIKLVEHMNSVDKDWRKESIVMLDNAQYHRGAVTTEIFKNLDLPVLYLGPYHFKMAPVEMMFSHIKRYSLNPYN
jgi:DDE superfamily endonuclease